MDRLNAVLGRLQGLHPQEIDLSLGRLERLLDKLGNPHLDLPPVIHIAGTNGKGSTLAFLRAALEADNKSVHVYTSPHLVNFRERIRLGAPDGSAQARNGGGRFVSDEMLADVLIEVEKVNDGAEITFFEITTAAAFVLFAEHPADILLLEVGLGGRLDATNVVETPLASIISVVSHDHERFLGDTLAEIAHEKAGILKPGVPAFVAPQTDEAMAVIEARAEEIGAPLSVGNRDWQAYEEHGRLVFQNEHGLLDLPLPHLFGRHQFINAGLAVAVLRHCYPKLPVAAIEKGLQTADWPARMQRLTAGTLFDRLDPAIELWVDGGHNPGAGEVVSAAMADLEDRAPKPLFLITGMLTTKDPVGYFRPFAGLARAVFTVPLKNTDGGRSPESLAEAAREAGLDARAVGGIADAILAIQAQLDAEDEVRVLIGGSLFLAGEVLAENHTPPA